ncbi:MAG: type 3-dehydroquinate dehydratase [Bacteroidota bacterium]|jgi:3-dehydroquinate dehydratase-2
MMKKILVLNGPNLNLLGKREPDIYGNHSFDEFFQELVIQNTNMVLSYYQSNVEGELINKLHEVGFEYDGIIFNAGGYTHTSVAIADAVAAIKTPVIEVHISNVHAREEYRHQSLMAKNCVGVITGLGMQGYELALEYFLKHA